MSTTLFPTSLVGSYPQPDWLIDRAQLSHRLPPRVRATDLWRVASEYLEEAQDDATILAIRAQERAGLEHPRHRKVLHIRGVDLIKRAVAPCELRTAVMRPVRLRRTTLSIRTGLSARASTRHQSHQKSHW